MVHTCVVFGCHNRANDTVKRGFFNFPKVRVHEDQQTKDLSKLKREKWIARIGRKEFNPSIHARVCGDHFVTGKPAKLYEQSSPDWAPSLKLTGEPTPDQKTASVTKRYNRVRDRKVAREKHVAAKALLELSTHLEYEPPTLATPFPENALCHFELAGEQISEEKPADNNINAAKDCGSTVTTELLQKTTEFQLHISIHKGVSTPPLQKCKNCCHPAQFHCPFCLSSSFEPTNYSKARHHLDKHIKKSIHLQGYTVHRCRLGCRNQPHYHCVYCPATRIRNQDLNKHVLLCLQKRDLQSSQLHTKGSTSPAKDDIESCDDGDGDDLTVITDRDHQPSRGASGSQRETPVVVQTVQTNSDKPQDCDEFYFMNLVKMFKKLSPQKKAEVRMKIERLLFEAEFD